MFVRGYPISEDAQQDAWVKFLERAGKDIEDPIAWRKVVARNADIQEIRARQKERIAFAEWYSENVEHGSTNQPGFERPQRKTRPVPPGVEAFRERNREYERKRRAKRRALNPPKERAIGKYGVRTSDKAAYARAKYQARKQRILTQNSRQFSTS